jgi:CRISPR-associated protein Cas1
MASLHDLPQYADRWEYVYLEMGQLDCQASSVVFRQGTTETPIPLDQFSAVLLGPGTTVTAGAMKVFAKNNCLVCWTGEEGTRLYAHGLGGTHSAHRLLHQAELYGDERKRLAVCRRMYSRRFGEIVSIHVSLQQLRGMEGARVRKRYEQLAAEYGLAWKGRRYDQDDWDWADPLNRALSVANACLHGLCHAAILSAGYSPAIGFIHTGKLLSFVYDVADFYKTEITVPLAFRLVAQRTDEIERRVRKACRDAFFRARIMDRILPDIAEVLDAGDHLEECAGELEGRAVSLAPGNGSGSVSGQSDETGARPPLGTDSGEEEGGLRAAGLD